MALARIGFSAGEVICNQIHGRSPIESPCHARTLPAVEWNVAESIDLGPSFEPAGGRQVFLFASNARDPQWLEVAWTNIA